MEKQNMRRRVLYAVAALLCMVGIFVFSAQSGVQSTAVSRPVAEKVAAAGVVQSEEQLKEVERIVRKTAHFAAYAVLAFFVHGFWHTFPLAWRRRALYTLAICAAYAAGDELHQRFVSGRSGNVPDVLLDTLGAAAMLLCILLAKKCFAKEKTKCP